MAIRKIIQIDEDKCNGCGLCVPNCAEGAIQIIDGKAKLVKDSYCDGLGACLGHCPMDALHIIEREAEDFNEEEAMAFSEKMKNANQEKRQTEQTVNKPLTHSNMHHHHGGCPGSRIMMFNNENKPDISNGIGVGDGDIEIKIKPQLRQWPVQLSLVPVNAPYFNNADLLVTADCVPFAYADYHLTLLKGKTLVVGCPKLDDIEFYTEKLTQILCNNEIKSITVAHMEVPCCMGIVRTVEEAVANSGKSIPVTKVMIGIDGSVK